MPNLPHLYPVGGVFFITFRLGDSLPQSVFDDIQKEYELAVQKVKATQKDVTEKRQKLNDLRKRLIGKYDHQLDMQPYGECHMKDENVAQIIHDKIMQYDGTYYDVLALSIMPNHVHMLLDTSIQVPTDTHVETMPVGYVDVSKWMQLIKGGSAHAINKYLGRKGSLWARESFDHFARNEMEISRMTDYIISNPTKAGLEERYSKAPYIYRKREGSM